MCICIKGLLTVNLTGVDALKLSQYLLLTGLDPLQQIQSGVLGTGKVKCAQLKYIIIHHNFIK